MNCRHCLDLVALHAVGAGTLPAAAQAHLDRCEDCQLMQASLRRSADALRGSLSEAAPAGLAVGVRRRLEQVRTFPGASFPVRWVLAAAAVVLVVGGGWWLRPAPDRMSNAEVLTAYGEDLTALGAWDTADSATRSTVTYGLPASLEALVWRTDTASAARRE